MQYTFIRRCGYKARKKNKHTINFSCIILNYIFPGDAENRVGGDLNFDPTLVNGLHELHQPHPPEMMSCDNYLHGESEIRLRFSTSSFTKLRCSRSQPLSVVI